jgi:mono/diheme cytochrome c family protein
VAFLALCALAAPWALRRWLWMGEQNPLLRGRLLAQKQGCVACHYPYGGTEIPNPGSRWGDVPRFESGVAMMYAMTRAEVEEFIRHGAPLAWLEDERIVERLASQRLRMPAFGDRLGDSEIGDLTAWASAVEGVEPPGDEAAQEGRRLAREQGCVSCHGPEGAGGLPNPGSIGGFVPGFVGDTFLHMVEGREEFEEWVRTGRLQRLANPLVRRAWRRQTISMPAFDEEALPQQDLDALWEWVQAVREEWAE